MNIECRPKRDTIVAVTLFLSFICVMPSVAHAWKIDTHIFAANLALQDAMNDGMVTIPPFGTFPVSPEALRVLKAFPAVYRAGVVGPDLFPDIYMGQKYAHTDYSTTADHADSDDWMRFVFSEAHNYNKTPGPERDRALAFAYGYLTHAAGDMFAHTYVNSYAGGVWDWGNPNIVSKHLALEGFVAKHTPPTDLTIDVYARFTSETLIKNPFVLQHARDARHYQTWLKLYAWLGKAINHGDKECRHLPPNPFGCLSRDYASGWKLDIDRGLRALVETNQTMAIAVMKNRYDQVLGAFTDWQSVWIPKMFGGHALGEINNFMQQIGEELAPITEAIRDQEIAWIKQVFPEVIRAVEKWTNPDTWMQSLFGPVVTSHIAYDELHVGPNGLLNWPEFGPLYNTVILSKLILLDGRSLNELARRAGVSAPVYREGDGVNIMLYVVKWMDANNQWEGIWKDHPYGVTFPSGFGPQAYVAPTKSGQLQAPGSLQGLGSLQGGPSHSGFLFWSNEDARQKVFARIFKGYGPGPGPSFPGPKSFPMPLDQPQPSTVVPQPPPQLPGTLMAPGGVRSRGTDSDPGGPGAEPEGKVPQTETEKTQ